MADTKTELQRKKEKLAQMREEKRKKEILAQKGAPLGVSTGAAGSAASTPNAGVDINDLIESLSLPPRSIGAASPTAGTNAAKSVEKPAEGGDSHSSPRLPMMRPKRLQQYKTEPVTIEPRERNVYTKETQTIFATSAESTGGEQEMLNFEESGQDIDTNATLAELQKIGVVPTTQVAEERHEEEPVKNRELSEEEKADLMLSENFQRFFDHTTRIIERAVHELPHINELFTDYTGASQEELENAAANRARLLLKHGRTFQWQSAPGTFVGGSGAAALKQRTVTDLDWSTMFPELLLASYATSNTDSLKDADGTVMIWNLKYRKDTPEYTLESQSAVMSACFTPFHPNLVIGGTYSGQIVLWDNRSNKKSPVQRSSVTNQGHTHPVYAVCVQGTQHAHNLLSISTDGLMCSWSLDLLKEPQERLELSYRQSKGVAASCMTFFSNDVNNFVVGTQEAMVFTGCRHGNKAGLPECFEGHSGPVTGVSCHPLPQATQGGLGSLFLSSSMDWTVKLWSNSMPKVSVPVASSLSTGSAVGPVTGGVSASSNATPAFGPIHTFEHYNDYLFDVQWSPVHPAMFASVDIEGWLYLWNINEDYEVPASKLQNDGGRGFNKLRWHSSGLHIACGDIDGRVQIFDLNEQLATPHSDEVSRLVSTINELQQTNLEQIMMP